MYTAESMEIIQLWKYRYVCVYVCVSPLSNTDNAQLCHCLALELSDHRQRVGGALAHTHNHAHTHLVVSLSASNASFASAAGCIECVSISEDLFGCFLDLRRAPTVFFCRDWSFSGSLALIASAGIVWPQGFRRQYWLWLRVYFQAGERETVGRSQEKEYWCNVAGLWDERPPLGASGQPQHGEQHPDKKKCPGGEKLLCTPLPKPQPGKT